MKADKLKEAISKKGLKNSFIAKKLGVNVNTVWRWSAGVSEPNDEKKEKLAKILDVPISYLFGNQDNSSPHDVSSKNYLIDTINNNGTANVANRMGLLPPENIVIKVGDVHMEFPKGTSADVIGAAIESARREAKDV
ncbi:MAG: helix-turn-helix domain-containing protein [Synergistaceae bacterium]|jgi:transcriptional regulator with XRE-family HTH domain|nr:helix-turn-helix domain-containing protein [Synergistaceae bacterium]